VGCECRAFGFAHASRERLFLEGGCAGGRGRGRGDAVGGEEIMVVRRVW
jgi:hypothetical protein